MFLPDENFQQLAAKSDGVVEWARLLCDFISPRIGVIPNISMKSCLMLLAVEELSSTKCICTTFLKDGFRGSDERRIFHSVMQQTLWLKEPLPISALDFMRNSYPVGFILNFMASLLAGASKVSTPVRPMHASFFDLLLEERRSGEFFIQQGDAHHGGLRFNICRPETYHTHLTWRWQTWKKQVQENIPPHLLYSCRL